MRIILATLLVLSSGLVTSAALAERIVGPAEGTPEATLLDAVRLVVDGDYEAFIARHCHPGLLCASPNAIVKLQREILPGSREQLSACLKDDGRALEVLGVEGDREQPDARLVYGLECGGRTHTVQVHRYKAKWWVVSL